VTEALATIRSVGSFGWTPDEADIESVGSFGWTPDLFPAPISVEEQVAQTLAAIVAGIAGPGGYLSGGFSRFVREGLPESPVHLSCVMYEDDPEPVSMDAGWIICKKPHVFFLFFQTPDGSDEPIAPFASNAGAVLQKAITQARPWNNLIIDVQWDRAPVSFPYGDSHYCRAVAANVLYRYRESDPMSQTG
jgi:hypothetical protein